MVDDLAVTPTLSMTSLGLQIHGISSERYNELFTGSGGVLSLYRAIRFGAFYDQSGRICLLFTDKKSSGFPPSELCLCFLRLAGRLQKSLILREEVAEK
jgi:hypothetical protein